MSKIKIDITSDTVCPWCYIGSKRLAKGIAAFRAAHPERSDDFEVYWRPFQLNPVASTTGVNKREYLTSRYGPGQVNANFARIAAAGEQEGIKFSFGGNTGNSRESHRLIRYAGTKGLDLQNRVVKELFTDYFEKEGDITSHKMLKAAAVRAGMDEAEVQNVLESDIEGPEVDKEVAEARANHISGVPNYRIQDTYELSGAQDPENFTQVLERLVTAGKA